MNEFDLIAHYFTRPTPSVDLGIGDDAALISVSPGHQLAISADMLVVGRHFFADANAERLGHEIIGGQLIRYGRHGRKTHVVYLVLGAARIKSNLAGRF